MNYKFQPSTSNLVAQGFYFIIHSYFILVVIAWRTTQNSREISRLFSCIKGSCASVRSHLYPRPIGWPLAPLLAIDAVERQGGHRKPLLVDLHTALLAGAVGPPLQPVRRLVHPGQLLAPDVRNGKAGILQEGDESRVGDRK